MQDTRLEFRARKNLYKNTERIPEKMEPVVDLKAFDITQAFLGKENWMTQIPEIGSNSSHAK